LFLATAAAVQCLMVGSAFAGDGTWDGGGSQTPGNAIWGGVNNWNPNGAVADGAGYTAFFGIAFANGYVVIVNTERTIGNIVFTDPANANDLLLQKHSSDYTLTLNNLSASPVINVTQAGRTLKINPRVGGTGGLTKMGPGILILNTNNTYSGNTVISNGILTLGHSLAMKNSVLDTGKSISGDADNGLRITVTTITLGGLAGGKDFASVFTTTSGGFETLTELTLNPGAGVVASYSGVIADGAAGMRLIKTGAGTQILSGANTFSGPAIVNEGELALNGGSLAAPVTVNAGGTLGLAGAGVIPSLEYTSSGAMNFDVANGGHLTVMNVNGITNSGGAGSIRINITGSAPAAGTYTLISYNGSLQGSGFGAYVLGSTPGGDYELIDTGTAVELVVRPDTTPPALLSAEGRGEMNHIYLVFSEPVGSNCIGNLSQYSVQMTNNGPMLSILSASLYSSNVVVLTTSDRIFSSNYIVQVSGVCDTAATPNTMTQTSLWLTLESTWMLISQNSQWRYYTNIFEPTPGYRDFSYPDEESWPTGLPLFGLETAGVYPWPILTPWPVSQNNPAYLARIHFNFPFNPAGVVLVSSNYVDDGVAYWLNGQPVGMIGFDPTTVPTQNDIYWNTFAQNAPEGQNRVLFFAPGALQQGENVLVAEVHQASPNGSDVAFGMLLVALMPKPIVITNQPQNQNVIEMRDATFTVGVDGSTPAYQWYYTNAGGIILLTDQTNATLVISSVTSANAGGYFVVVTNVLGAVTSQVATLSVTADLTPPTLLSARITGQNMITVTFDENVDPVSASDPMNYTVQDADGNSIMFYLVEVSGSNVTISLSAFVNSNIEYVVTAETIGDLVNPPNIMTIGTVRTGRKLTLIGLSSSWSYNDTGANLGTAWREYTYPEESSWPTATAWLGFETNTFITINNLTHISTNTNAGIGGTIITYYFRQHFNFDGDPAAATLLLEYGFDDGGIVYLNGHRVFSLNMTNAEYGYTNFTDVGGADVTATSVTNIPNTYLRRGDNVIAVEVHQDNRTSSDLVFGLALHADVLPSTTIVPPTIRVQPPASSYVSVNSNLTLSVVAQATAPFSYQWYLNGTELALMTDSTLVIGNAQSANEGQYWVVVSNAAGVATSQVAQVTVLEVPVITHQPAGMNVAVGGTAVFAVEVNGRLLSYQWYHVTETATNLLAGKTNATLTITNVQGANAGGYYVVVRDPVHTVTSATAQLMIGAVTRPQIVGDRSNRTVATLQFITEPGVVYTLQRAMSMSLPITWQDVPGPGATVTGDGTLKTLTDADASVPHRFYRVKATTP